MTALVHALLLRRAETYPVGGLLAVATLASASFGAAIGAYVGGLQILYGALKMPLFFLGTLGVSFAAMHLFAARELRARRTFDGAVETIATTAVVLGSLAPVAGLFSLSCPKPSPRAYSFLILLLTASVAAGGIVGVVRLHARLRSWNLTAAWVLIYQFTGAQMAWLLKPWVSHTLRDDRFLPLRENLNGNFYESVFRTISGFF
jgi:hypothetical protein